jgi:hypothetical protein
LGIFSIKHPNYGDSPNLVFSVKVLPKSERRKSVG